MRAFGRIDGATPQVALNLSRTWDDAIPKADKSKGRDEKIDEL
jgi:hypothetical protein